MNLYEVREKNHAWACYCFAATANRAKAMVAHEFDDADYIDLRCVKLKRGTGKVQYETLVPDEQHELYEIVCECGGEYLEEE